MTTDPTGHIEINKTEYKKLTKALLKARQEGEEIFKYNNTLLIDRYAEYLLQYMELKLKIKKHKGMNKLE